LKELKARVKGYKNLQKRSCLGLPILEKHSLLLSSVILLLSSLEDFLPEVEILGSIYAGLVTVDKQSNTVCLVYYTTQEYFEQISLFPNTETDITLTCITYLLFSTFATGFCLSDKEFKRRLQLNLLYNYTARN
jgi:hypothetical protein